MSRRHYKQKFDPSPDAKYVWLCRRQWTEGPMTEVGDDVVENRPGDFKKLWNINWIGLKDWVDPNAPKPKREPPKPPKVKPSHSIEELDGNRFKVTHDGKTQTVCGKRALKALLTEITGGGG